MYGEPSESQFEIFPRSNPFANIGAHKTMLKDAARLQAFEGALKETIVPNESIVLDVGTGTGILALMAARLGARHVYAIDSGPTIALAQEIAADNDLDEHITFMRSDVSETSLPEQADVIVSETIGLIGVEEDVVKILATAQKRFAHERTIFVPSKLNLAFAPITSPEMQTALSRWKEKVVEFDVSRIHTLAYNNLYGRLTFSEDQFLAQPQKGFGYTLGVDQDASKKEHFTFAVEKTATLHGFAVWFDAVLSPSHALSSSPMAKKTHWQQSFIPVEAAEVSPGDSLELSVDIDNSKDLSISWKCEIVHPDGTKHIAATHSTETLREYTM